MSTTKFQVVDPELARITGIPLQAGERLPVGLEFTGTGEANGRPFNIYQVNGEGVDKGGVEYRLTFR